MSTTLPTPAAGDPPLRSNAQFRKYLQLNPGGVDTPLLHGMKPLHYAAATGCVTAISLLLRSGSKALNSQDRMGRTPLIVAVAYGHEPFVASLLLQKPDVNVRDQNGMTALHRAVLLNRSVQTIEKLLGAGANPNIPDVKGVTPLQTAVQSDFNALVVTILSRSSFPLSESLWEISGRPDLLWEAIDKPCFKALFKAHLEWGIPIFDKEHLIFQVNCDKEFDLLGSLFEWEWDGTQYYPHFNCGYRHISTKHLKKLKAYHFRYYFGHSLTFRLLQQL